MGQLKSMQDSLNKVHTDIALLGQRLDSIEEKRATVGQHATDSIAELKVRVGQLEVTTTQQQKELVAMEPVKRLAYGCVTVIITAVAAAVLYLVIRQPI